VAPVRVAAWLSPEPEQAQVRAEALLAEPAQARQAEVPPAGLAQAPAAVPPLPVLAPARPEVALLPVPELEQALALRPGQVEARL
jgi:hypothetical protein